VYGLAADITSKIAVEKIFKIKERPFFDPLIVHLANKNDAQKVVSDFPPLAQKLATHFWPGPLTMILPKQKDLNPMITAGIDTVGIRVPNHELTRKLISELGNPVAAPSANKFTKTSPTQAQHVQNEFGDKVFVLDGGPCQVGIESTIIEFNDDSSEIFILRQGHISQEALSEFAKTSIKKSDKPNAPGQFKQHYQPSKPLVILSENRSLNISLYETVREKLKLEIMHPAWISLPNDASLAARLLYANLHKLSSDSHSNCIFLNYDMNARTDGPWSAITDRLTKAASLIV